MKRVETLSETRIRKAMVTMPGTAGVRLPSFGDNEMSMAEIADYLEDLRGIVARTFEALNKAENENRTYRSTFRGLQDFMTLVQSGGVQ